MQGMSAFPQMTKSNKMPWSESPSADSSDWFLPLAVAGNAIHHITTFPLAAAGISQPSLPFYRMPPLLLVTQITPCHSDHSHPHPIYISTIAPHWLISVQTSLCSYRLPCAFSASSPGLNVVPLSSPSSFGCHHPNPWFNILTDLCVWADFFLAVVALTLLIIRNHWRLFLNTDVCYVFWINKIKTSMGRTHDSLWMFPVVSIVPLGKALEGCGLVFSVSIQCTKQSGSKFLLNEWI